MFPVSGDGREPGEGISGCFSGLRPRSVCGFLEGAVLGAAVKPISAALGEWLKLPVSPESGLSCNAFNS